MIHRGAIDLSRSPVHISTHAAKDFAVLEGFGFDGPSFESYVQDKCSDEDPGCLVMIENSPASWPTWERHPAGDELVFILEGHGTFFHEIDGEPVPIEFAPGDTILNPKGVWHTADLTEPLRAIYITTCPETDHKPRK